MEQQKPDLTDGPQNAAGDQDLKNVAKTRGSEQDISTVKYTYIHGCKSGSDIGLENTRMFFEWTQLLLRNFDPNSMEAIFPDIFSDIKGINT